MTGSNSTPVSIELDGAEIVSWIPGANVAAVCGGDNTVRFVKYDSNFQNPEVVLEKEFDGDIQSVAAHGTYFAVAESPGKTEKGRVSVYHYNASHNSLRRSLSTTVGYLPDSVDWSPDGKTIVVANEGEPTDFYGTADGIDPEGSISVIRLNDDKSHQETKTLGFGDFTTDQLESAGVRLSGAEDKSPADANFVADARGTFTLHQTKEKGAVATIEDALTGETLYVHRNMRGQNSTAFEAEAGEEFAVSWQYGAEKPGAMRSPADANFAADAAGTFTLHQSKTKGAVATIEDTLTGETLYVHRNMRGQNSTAFEAEAGEEFTISWQNGAVKSGAAQLLDIEPEFVKITPDSKRAVVTLQENNAMVVVNLETGTLEKPTGLGAKDWTGLSVDTSDKDGGYLPGDRDFKSLYMPDGMDVFTASNGTTYAVMANEGDGRVRPDDLNFEADDDGTFTLHQSKSRGAVAEIEDPLTGNTVYVHRDMGGQNSTAFEAEAGDEFFITWKHGAVADDDFYSDEKRAGKLDGPQGNSIVSGDGEGRLKTVVDQNTADSITGFGGRSFTIRDLDGSIIWDSGDALDRIAAEYDVYDDGRSDDKGVEPEHVEIATLGDRSFAFISLERGTSTLIPVYEITNVDAPEHVYTFHAANSVSPEATEFVKTSASGGTLLVSSEVSGTLDAFNFSTSLV